MIIGLYLQFAKNRVSFVIIYMVLLYANYTSGNNPAQSFCWQFTQYLRYCSKVQFVRSVWLFVRGQYTVESLYLIPTISANNFYILLINSLSLSDIIFFSILWLANIYLNNRNTIVLALIISIVRIIYKYFVSRSTTTIIMSFPSDSGSLVIKSSIIYSYSRVGISEFCNSLYRVCCKDLSR